MSEQSVPGLTEHGAHFANHSFQINVGQLSHLICLMPTLEHIDHTSLGPFSHYEGLTFQISNSQISAYKHDMSVLTLYLRLICMLLAGIL